MTHLQHSLIVDLVEDGAVDLIGLQCRPVKHGEAELGLDGLLDSNGCEVEMTHKPSKENLLSCWRDLTDSESSASPERPTLRNTDGEASGRGGATGGGGGGGGGLMPGIGAENKQHDKSCWFYFLKVI